MLSLTVRNSVILSLVQVAVAVFGILSAATSERIARTFGHTEVFSADVLMDSGLLLLSLPLLWIIVVLVARSREDLSDDAKQTAFLCGYLLLLLLAVAAAFGIVHPWTSPVSITHSSG